VFKTHLWEGFDIDLTLYEMTKMFVTYSSIIIPEIVEHDCIKIWWHFNCKNYHPFTSIVKAMPFYGYDVGNTNL
jgi:hypothetical protein